MPPAPELPALSVVPVSGLGEVRPGDDLVGLLARALTEGLQAEGATLGSSARGIEDGDVLVVTQKVVSKVEGRVIEVDPSDPLAKTRVAEAQAVRVLRRRDELVVTETAHGFVCANSGVDLSNVAPGTATLLPLDPDRSARRIREGLRHLLGVDIGVVVSDTFGRTWRRGLTDVAIGCAGVAAIVDLRGTEDHGGRELVSTEVCVADELAGAADLVMGKNLGVPAALVRGVPRAWLRTSSVAAEVVRPPAEDLFR